MRRSIVVWGHSISYSYSMTMAFKYFFNPLGQFSLVISLGLDCLGWI